MTISKTAIIAYVNEAMETSYSGSDLDIAIQAVLDDLSGMFSLLEEDTSQSLSSSSYYLSYPSDCLDGEVAVVDVVLTDSSSVRGEPLRHLNGGWQEYGRLMEAYTTSLRSLPKYMVRHDRKIYVWPPPDGTYTSSIWYYKLHQAVDSGIEFPDSWRQAIYQGTVWQKALLIGRQETITQWEPKYNTQKELCRLTITRRSKIMGA